jgi:sugar lactone lactonase YvrE
VRRLAVVGAESDARASLGSRRHRCLRHPAGWRDRTGGLAVGPDGNVYVTTFGFNSGGAVTGLGQLYVFDPAGHLIRQKSIANSSPHLLGVGFYPTTHAFLVIDFGAAQVLKVDPHTGASSVFMTVRTPRGNTGLNALTFDSAGNVYVSDSFNGIIWKTGPGGGLATAWVPTNPLLTTAGVPPFGANGLGFNRAGNSLFVANTGNDTVVKIPVSGGVAGAAAVFVNSINGADGLVLGSMRTTISGWRPTSPMRSSWSIRPARPSPNSAISTASTKPACRTG